MNKLVMTGVDIYDNIEMERQPAKEKKGCIYRTIGASMRGDASGDVGGAGVWKRALKRQEI